MIIAFLRTDMTKLITTFRNVETRLRTYFRTARRSTIFRARWTVPSTLLPRLSVHLLFRFQRSFPSFSPNIRENSALYTAIFYPASVFGHLRVKKSKQAW